jgi:hypothetical protein
MNNGLEWSFSKDKHKNVIYCTRTIMKNIIEPLLMMNSVDNGIKGFHIFSENSTSIT